MAFNKCCVAVSNPEYVALSTDVIGSGLPGLVNIPKWENVYKITTICVKIHQTAYKRFQNGHTIIKIFHSKAYKNKPKFGFLVLKHTIWQPCIGSEYENFFCNLEFCNSLFELLPLHSKFNLKSNSPSWVQRGKKARIELTVDQLRAGNMVTRSVGAKKCRPTSLCQIKCITFTKVTQQLGCIKYLSKNDQRKPSLNRRKIYQSGHPGGRLTASLIEMNS
jgi:hypothetical protein